VTSPHIKSARNHGTEKEGIRYLLGAGGGYHKVSSDIKRRILDLLSIDQSNHTPRCFDLVRVRNHRGRTPRLTLQSVEPLVADGKLRLIEVKTTKAEIPDATLSGFFFGATQSEYKIAKRLGDSYAFAFVVLNKQNVFGTFFHVELTLAEVTRRTLRKRIQYQVNLR